MCLDRIYVRRRRDGRLLRFKSMRALRVYCKSEHMGKKGMPIITRTQFIGYKNAGYDDPRWITSKIYDGMAILVESASK